MANPFHNPASATIANLEAAFAGESMAHIKYRYFAKLCREMGDEDTARAFEATAEQEVMHAFGHLPKKGEAVTLGGFTFKVVHADRRRLLQLQVKIPQTHEADGDASDD